MEHAITLDIGGTNIKYALVGRDGSIVFESVTPSRSQEVLARSERSCAQWFTVS